MSDANIGITSDEIQAAKALGAFVAACPSMFHTAATLRARLEREGFTFLPEDAPWHMVRGGRYFTVRNNSSLIAFSVGSELDHYHFQVAAAHGDSPAFKVKAVPELSGPGESLRLSVEAYGGMIDYTWFDRPLSLAGRVMVRAPHGVESRLVAIDRPVALIPSLAIHLDGSVNKGFAPRRNVDLCPLFSAGELGKGAFVQMVAEEVGVAADEVLGYDLYLVNRQEPCVWGQAHEFISAPKLDDLGCAYAAFSAFLGACNPHDVSVYCCFDNEEVGSNTKQGAMFTFLADTLARANAALGYDEDVLRRAVAASMMVSCDNAHAVHPNHPERYDEGNRAYLNGGIVVKEAANQHYCSDAFSRAIFTALCQDAGVPCQTFANRSDMAGGSTLGNLSNIQVSMNGVDVGLPQLAMHSAYETAGVRDVSLGIRAIRAFYDADIRIDGAKGATFA